MKLPETPLLDIALTHSSYANERGYGECNERLEFLGDAVLGLLVGEYLYVRYPEGDEGELSRWRAMLICEENLAIWARELKLGKRLYLGKGEEVAGGRERTSILADAFEAVVAGIYLSHGLEKTREFLLGLLPKSVAALESGQGRLDYKTMLQEEVQRQGTTVRYSLEDQFGPDHAKLFEVSAWINGELCGRGKGRSKKEAEQGAASVALGKITGM